MNVRLFPVLNAKTELLVQTDWHMLWSKSCFCCHSSHGEREKWSKEQELQEQRLVGRSTACMRRGGGEERSEGRRRGEDNTHEVEVCAKVQLTGGTTRYTHTRGEERKSMKVAGGREMQQLLLLKQQPMNAGFIQ